MKKIKTGGMRRRFAIGAAGARGGLGLLSSKASGLLLPKKQQHAHQQAALEREAMRFVKELGELKGAYVKIGQMLALYGEHLLPKPVTDALHTLEAQTTELEWSVIKPHLQTVFVEQLSVLEIQPNSFAAASLAQVHMAVASNIPEPLCVKIQYPGIAGAIKDDFRNVTQMLTLARWIKSGRQLEELTKELKFQLIREVDYGYELGIAKLLREKLANDDRYRVPKYFSELSNQSVLTMEFIGGYEVTHPKVQGLSQPRRNALAMSMLELFFKEAFDWGVMQTDPNFGNYRIIIDSIGNCDQLGLLDFGAVHHLSESFTRPLRKTILAAHSGDAAKSIEGAIELGCLRETDSDIVKQSFAEFCSFMLEPFSNDISSLPGFCKTSDNLYDWHSSRLLKRAGKLGSEGMLVKGFVIPPAEFLLMVRKLTGVFTFVSTLGAHLDAAFLLEKYRS
ncbi:MAG: putative unusual protein kinase regulating ubiquinone biosynthesis (AarF/ABC1/UbiB family) [Arenicella sp.]|jgi:predicted unusual protein kinase regulating ubiquinone biosynthesis (AarF/ABC1/UbiB family)